MRKLIGRVGRDVLIESVVVTVDGRTEHRYRLVGGRDDGREFESLTSIGDYVIGLSGDSPY
jgi:hypothetical protein